ERRELAERRAQVTMVGPEPSVRLARHLVDRKGERAKRNTKDGAALRRLTEDRTFTCHRLTIHEEAVRDYFPVNGGLAVSPETQVVDVPAAARQAGSQKRAVLERAGKPFALPGRRG